MIYTSYHACQIAIYRTLRALFSSLCPDELHAGACMARVRRLGAKNVVLVSLALCIRPLAQTSQATHEICPFYSLVGVRGEEEEEEWADHDKTPMKR